MGKYNIMELFSEIYSAYYRAVSKILSCRNLTSKDIAKIISENAFSESSLYIMPKIKDEWKLVSEKNGIYNSRLKKNPSVPFTLLEKRWLKSVLSDPKAVLFIDRDIILRLNDYLKDIKPLFSYDNFLFFDRFSDGDDFSNPNYIRFFRIIHRSLKDRKVLNITFVSSKGKRINHDFLPVKFEYSPKNDKFRLYAQKISGEIPEKVNIINISRITDIRNTEKSFLPNTDTENILLSERCSEPVCVEVSSERNGIERFMTEFAGYEKITEFSKEEEKCTASIWYNKTDETELLIRLLSFGTVLKIKSPEYFRNLARERIKKQCSFFSENH